MTLPLRRLTLLSLFMLLVSSGAHADRRYFLQSYTPYLAPAGTLELEMHAIARAGQGDSTNTAWENRAEFEYAIADRLTGALYFNFVQPGGESGAQRFDGPSLELICALAERGRIPLDPAAYLEVRENGDELEVEPKLLLAHRHRRLVGAINLIGEFERHHAGAEKGTTEKSLSLTGGLSRELGAKLALGAEAVYRRVLGDLDPHPSTVLVGPTLNLQTEKVQLALGWHPQVWGSPRSSAHLDLADFPRSEVRLVLGVDL
jgi:hypothetical protein